MNKSLKLVALSAVSTAKDDRQYYTAEFQDPSNPFAKTVKRNFWQQKNAAGTPEWRGADPAVVKNFVGRTIPGQLMTAKVEPYTVIGAGGVERTANIFTTAILGSELPEQVFKSLNHPLAVEAAVEETVAEAAEMPVL